MNDDVEVAVQKVIATLRASKKLTFMALTRLLGEDRDFIAKVLAQLLIRGRISTGREGSTLFVTLIDPDREPADSVHGREGLATGTSG